MTKTIRAVFDGETLRPTQPVDLRANHVYVLTVEAESSDRSAPDEDIYPLTAIGQLSADMGVADLAERHNHYAHGGAGTQPKTDGA